MSGTLNEDRVIHGEALENLSSSWAQPPIDDARPYYPGNLSMVTTDATHAMDPYSMFNRNGDFFASSVNDASWWHPYHDLCDASPEYGAMPFSPTEPPMQRLETNVSAASTAWLEFNTEFNPPHVETSNQPETEVANVSNLELGNSPSVLEAASPTRHAPKGKNGPQRIHGPRLFCPDCAERPNGFRGNHELARHRKAKHQACVKRFVCRDPTEAGLMSKLSALQPLSGCKNCAMGKEYNTDYNAAAHLLNGHFKNKPLPPRNRNSVKEPGGGRNQKPMIGLNDMRPWIMEFTVNLGKDCKASNGEQCFMDDDAAKFANKYAEIANHADIARR
ncbi:hypothetical protein E4U57_004517 [Claviceps arundinis]|uniref:DUF7896 domain-containing protein n=1 Tax=Claviceps arundinis TaxID=1623583 RepID=A0ABQ7PIW6_9HYPO|nr:hypothetical protein E4U57_004517 [Claviceps arundinis]